MPFISVNKKYTNSFVFCEKHEIKGKGNDSFYKDIGEKTY